MLQNILNSYSIILASGSPRRQKILKELEIPYIVKTFDVEEVYDETLQKEEITDYLSELKSKPFDSILKENELVITSDTIVWQDNKALGKPRNYEEAFQMLKSLSGKSHEVITSICFKTTEFSKTINDTTKVYFRKLLDEEIHFYIKNFKPYDKAGSYGIQEWIGYIGVEKIEGNYQNVIGLPVHKLYSFLRNHTNKTK